MIQTFCGYTGLLNFLSCLSLAFFLYFKNRSGKINRLFALWSTCVAFWSLGYFMWLFTEEREVALFWTRVLMAGAIVIPSSFLHFTLAYTHQEKSHLPLILFGYIFSLIYLVLDFTPLFIQNVESRFWFRWWPVPGPLYHLYQAYFILMVIYTHVVLFRQAWVAPSEVLRKHFKIVALGTLVAYLGGSTNFFLWYNIPIPPVFNFLVTGYVAFIAYAILHYRLWDIEVIIKKTLVFAGLFAMVMAVVAGVTTVMQGFIKQYLNVSPMLSTALSVLLAVVLYDPTRKFLVNITDKYLFQRKENIKDILNKLSAQIITILDLEKVGKTILSTLQNLLRLESGAILVKDESGNTFPILDHFGFKADGLSFPSESLFIRFFIERGQIVNLESEEEKKLLPSNVRELLEKMKTHIAMPLYVYSELIAVLTLGKKKSDEDFRHDETDYFPTLAGQVAIALSNARLYEILKKSEMDFAQQAKLAAIGTLAAGIGHEVKNPLGIIRAGLEMLIFNNKQGVYGDLSKEEYQKEVEEVLHRAIAATDRANKVISRLSSFAKKPSDFEIELVSLEEAMELALSFVKSDLSAESITVEKNFDPSVPKIKADLHALADGFLNLLVNAKHAIQNKDNGERKIILTTTKKGSEIETIIKDTGAGIKPEHLDKIFDPFFTTKDTTRNTDKDSIKGSGLGLFLVRETLKKFGGRLSVNSKVGEGTAFHIIFSGVDGQT